MRRPLPAYDADKWLAVTAAGQHGVVTRGQMLAAAMTPGMVRARVRSGRLRPIHRGVYLLGALHGRLKPKRAREMAAVLACGPGALVSHESAAGSMWELVAPSRLGLLNPEAPVFVTVPGRNAGHRLGIRRHRVRQVGPQDRAVVDGIPVTAVARTLVDLACRVPLRVLEQAFAQADRRGLANPDTVAAALARRPRAVGSEALRACLKGQATPAFTRSEAEDRLLELIRSAELPEPETNVRISGFELDFAWRAQKVAVEVDGYEFHKSHQVFGSDRRRDAKLVVLGFRVIRVTWKDITERPNATLVQLAQTLVGTPSPGSLEAGPR